MNNIFSYFKELIERIKKISSTPSDVDAYQIANLVSEKMINHIMFVQDLYENNTERIPWLKSGEIKSLHLSSIIAQEVARVACSEAEIIVDGSSERAKYLNEQLQTFIDSLQKTVEKGVALGNLAFKPYVSGGNVYVDVVRIGGYMPIAIEASGVCSSCVFTQSTICKGATYTKLEYHHISSDGVYTIENAAYRSNSITAKGADKHVYDIGRKVSLKEIPAWADIEPIVQFDRAGDVIQPLYAIYTNPFANSVDMDSMLGVSIVAKAINLIKDADENWESARYEMKSGERRLIMSKQAMPKDPREKLSRVFAEANFDDDNTFIDFSPALRNGNYSEQQQEIYRQIEAKCGLSYGVISDPQTIARTATEINAGKDKMRETVSGVQAKMKTAIEQLVRAMDETCDLYGITPSGPYQTMITWSDSALDSSAEKQALALMEFQNGLIDRVQYYCDAKGMTKDEALAFAQEMQSREPQPQGQDWFNTEGA